jgi:hypothetical protein
MDVGGIRDVRLQATLPQSGVAQRKTAPELHKVPWPPRLSEAHRWSEIAEAAENNRTVQMEFDKEIGKVIIQVIDGQTQKIVAQTPSEELVNLMKRIGSYLKLTTEGRI